MFMLSEEAVHGVPLRLKRVGLSFVQLGLAILFLVFLSGCEILKKPIIFKVSPLKATPGTEVLIEGNRLGNPELDVEPPHLFLGEHELCFEPQNPTCPVLEWTPTRIRWVVPLVPPGIYPIYVETGNGKSNEVEFEVLKPVQVTVGAYIVGILDQAQEELKLLRLVVKNNEIQPVSWQGDERGPTEIGPYVLPLSHPGMKTELRDLLLRSSGDAYVLLQATPIDPTVRDGIHGFYRFSQNFTSPAGFVTTSTFPWRFLDFEGSLLSTGKARFGVYAEGGNTLSFFEEAELKADFSLLFLGFDFAPLGFFPVPAQVFGTPSLFISGRYASSGTAAIHWIEPQLSRDGVPASLQSKSVLTTGTDLPEGPLALSPSGTTLYAILEHPNGTTGIVAYTVDSKTATVSFQAELTLPSGFQPLALSVQDSGIWVLLDGLQETRGGLLLFLNPLSFPTESTNYTSWAQAITGGGGMVPVTGAPPFAEIPITHPVAYQFLPQPQGGFILIITRSGDLWIYPQSPPYDAGRMRKLLSQVAEDPVLIRAVGLQG